MNEDIDHVRLRIEAVVEDVLKDHRLGDGPARVTHQIFEQSEFARLEVDFFFAAMDFAFEQIHGEIANDEAGWFGRLGGATNERLHAREQFGKCEWLGEIIIAACLEAADTVVHRSFGAENEDGGANVFATQLPDNAQAVEFGEHDVHNGGVVRNRLRSGEAIFAIRALINGKAALFEAVDNKRGNFWVILDDQDAHGGQHKARDWLRELKTLPHRSPVGTGGCLCCMLTKSAFAFVHHYEVTATITPDAQQGAFVISALLSHFDRFFCCLDRLAIDFLDDVAGF